MILKIQIANANLEIPGNSAQDFVDMLNAELLRVKAKQREYSKTYDVKPFRLDLKISQDEE